MLHARPTLTAARWRKRHAAGSKHDSVKMASMSAHTANMCVCVACANAYACMFTNVLLMLAHINIANASCTKQGKKRNPVCMKDSLESAALKTDSLLIHLVWGPRRVFCRKRHLICSLCLDDFNYLAVRLKLCSICTFRNIGLQLT